MLGKAAILSLLAAVSASLVAPAAATTTPQTFNLLDVTEVFTPLGFSNGPPHVGDRFVFTDSLYRWAGRKRGARVGRVEGLCTFAKHDDQAQVATLYCTASAFIPAGQVLVAGFIRSPENAPLVATLPVIGGTGAYANVRGWVQVRDIGGENSNNSNLAFHLMP